MLLLFLAPLLIFTSLLIFLVILENPFFRQKRFIDSNKFFTIYKLKTITKNKKNNFFLHFLRFTHLDELPQLINIIKGEMNFIGPRAMDMVDYKFCSSHFSQYYKKLLIKRLNSKGGIFGLSQLLGLGFNQKLDNIELNQKKIFFDCYYIKYQNFIMNILILILTPLMLFKLSNNHKAFMLKLIKKNISKKPM